MITILIVLIGVSLVGSLVLLNQTSSESNRKLDETIKKMEIVIKAIAAYKVESAGNANPPTLAHLYSDVGAVGCTPASSALAGWCGPYLTDAWTGNSSDTITDGWGTTFFYNNATSTLRSWGPNKTDNTGGSDDITRTF